MRAALVLAAVLGGCTVSQVAPQTVDRAVREAPCDAGKLPPQPVFPMATLSATDRQNVFTIGTTLWADYKARQAYELELRTFAEGCARREP